MLHISIVYKHRTITVRYICIRMSIISVQVALEATDCCCCIKPDAPVIEGCMPKSGGAWPNAGPACCRGCGAGGRAAGAGAVTGATNTGAGEAGATLSTELT